MHCNIILVERQQLFVFLLNYPHEMHYNILLDQMGEIE
jgi:hypothetical protein